jgi:predicted Zn-dependent peptidase
LKKVVILIIIAIQGVLVSAELSSLNIKNSKVPFIFEEDRNLPIVSMQLIFKDSGSLTDTKNGLVKLTAKLLNEGTKKDGSVGFARKLENRAINLSIHSGAETFVIELDSLKSQFSYAVELLKELFSDPNYTEKTLQKVKIQTLGELKRKESDFDYISMLKMKGMVFPNTPLAQPSLGTVESVKSISLDNIKEYVSNHLGIENAIVVMGGDINRNRASQMVQTILNILPHIHPKPIPKLKAVSKEQIKITEVNSKQAYIYFGTPLNIPFNSEELYLSKVASFILGSSGFGSRLMEEIRVKRGLAYSIYSRFTINKSHSYFWGYLQTKVMTQDEAVNSVKEIINKFINKGVTQEELEAAKQFLLGSEPLRNETLSQRLSKAFQEYYHNRPLGATLKDLKLIKGIKLNELNRFISKHKEINKLSFSIVTAKSKR